MLGFHGIRVYAVLYLSHICKATTESKLGRYEIKSNLENEFAKHASIEFRPRISSLSILTFVRIQH